MRLKLVMLRKLMLFCIQTVLSVSWTMEHKQTYSRGKPISTLTCSDLPLESKGTKGTSIRFWPDKEVFTTAIEFDHNTIAGRIRDLAFLNPKVTISLKKEEDDPEKNQYTEHFNAGGLKEYVSWLNTDKASIHSIWRERNARRHGEPSTDPSLLARYIDKHIRNRIDSMRGKVHKKYDKAMQLWFASR